MKTDSKKRFTVVLEYEGDTWKEQSFFNGQMALGGKIVAVMFDDGLERIEQLETQIEALEDEIQR